jgi:anthranilate synthase component 1
MALTTKVNPRLIKTLTTTVMGDTHTPVSIFLKLRDKYKSVLMLEANDFTSKEDCKSYIAVDIVDEFIVSKGSIRIYEDGVNTIKKPIHHKKEVVDALQEFIDLHQGDAPHIFNGCFGHTNFEAVQYFEDIQFNKGKDAADIPAIRYSTFRYILEFDHFKDSITVIQNCYDNEESNLESIVAEITIPVFDTYDFELVGETSSNMSDDDFKQMVRTGKKHCQQGNVFQIVFSRRFHQSFQGDEFNVYRVLRSLNPSPYLFYFDYGAYRLFGSSPESQLVISDGIASVNPIAGTFKRSGLSKIEDAQKALDLSADPKENAEHIMLVDLARNDLSRHCSNVRIKNLKEVHFFSHVIHLVSKVEGDLKHKNKPIEIFGDTFPAGTLSGAPKHKAMEIIDEIEPTGRSFYGGAIGFIDFQGNMNQAILIRSFLSINNELHFQAGAGIVIDSNEDKELQEINNKLGALHAAIKKATDV